MVFDRREVLNKITNVGEMTVKWSILLKGQGSRMTLSVSSLSLAAETEGTPGTLCTQGCRELWAICLLNSFIFYLVTVMRIGRGKCDDRK